MMIILSHFQAKELLEAEEAGKSRVQSSLDLGLSTNDIVIEAESVCFSNGQTLGYGVLEQITESPNSCFLVEAGAARKVQKFSQHTNRLYSLMPTEGAPTMLISGVPMHRIKGTDPYHDTLEKIKTVKPVVGTVLDTSTGLGYTAIEAAKTAERVITIELDPAALEVARHNPWSQPLFNNPRIAQRLGDSFDVVPEFADEMFSRVVHDPPAFNLAGDLYSGQFYAELYRVLERGGRLFHYIGDPTSKSGHTITRGVLRRLREAGFRRVVRRPRAFGVVAYK
jgi:predicted methyltransferase